MNEIKHTHDAYIEENGFVRARTFAHVTDNGTYLGKMEIMNRLIQPDEDYSNEAKKIIRACDSQFVPTVKARHLANKAFEAATAQRQQAIAAKDAAIKLKDEALVAKTEAKEAHYAAVKSKVQADIDGALVLRDKANAANSAAITAKAEAITQADEVTATVAATEWFCNEFDS